jgi:heme/copper-type cytochrome/quinol oxidase subunit 4
MAEEAKQEEKKAEPSKVMSTIIKVILGLVLLVLAVYLLLGRHWWAHTWLVIKGCAGPFLILAGIITLAIAKE